MYSGVDCMSNHNEEVEKNIKSLSKDKSLHDLTTTWFNETIKHNYSFNFSWMGRPIIQYPQDMIAMQEILWKVQPDLIIETGIAHGGSLIYYASILELIGKGEVLGIDIDIRAHNRQSIEEHSMFKRISLVEGSSISEEVLEQVATFAKNKQTILVILDSNHSHDHVLKELELYSPFVTKESYLVVFDTVIEDMPNKYFHDRPWGNGNNPKTAVWEFLKENDSFVIDKDVQNKLLITVAPDGYLKRVK
jgi:cephalosporin hydroxylase